MTSPKSIQVSCEDKSRHLSERNGSSFPGYASIRSYVLEGRGDEFWRIYFVLLKLRGTTLLPFEGLLKFCGFVSSCEEQPLMQQW